MRPVLLPLLFALGCPTDDTGIPPEGDTDTDTDTDTDSDTDSDTDADTDPAVFDGSWDGEVVVDVYERSLGLSGTCQGDASFLFDHAAEDPIVGAAACDFGEQPIAEYVPPLSFAFTGAHTDENRLRGQVVTTAGYGEATGPWEGSITEDMLLVTWSGTVVYYHYTVDYEGSVSAW
ncbi:MAG: hypothetical protein ABIO70_07735 [Pseudomonadota bacterium]